MTSASLKPEPELKKKDSAQSIVENVLGQLGKPNNLCRIDIKNLWDDRYRINVYCNIETDGPVKNVELTDSFFVSLKDDKIVTEPTIVRKYQKA